MLPTATDRGPPPPVQAALGLEGLGGALNGPMGWVGRGLLQESDTLQPQASG